MHWGQLMSIFTREHAMQQCILINISRVSFWTNTKSNPTKVNTAILKSKWQLIHRWAAVDWVISSSVLSSDSSEERMSHASSTTFPWFLSPHIFSLHSSTVESHLVWWTKTQGNDANEGNMDAVEDNWDPSIVSVRQQLFSFPTRCQ